MTRDAAPPMPAAMQALSEALMSARSTAAAHDAAIDKALAAVNAALPDANAMGMQTLALGTALRDLEACRGSLARVLAAHQGFDKMRKVLGLPLPASSQRGPGGGR